MLRFLAPNPDRRNTLYREIKQARLFVGAEKLRKIPGSIGFLQARGIGSHQHAQIVFDIVITTILDISSKSWVLSFLRGICVCINFFSIVLAKGDSLSLIGYPHGNTTGCAIKAHALPRRPFCAPGG